MSAGLRLDLRQSQQLVMTPQLQQAIKLLQMSNLDLLAFVDQQVEQNPLLTRETPETAPEPPVETPAAEAQAKAEPDTAERVTEAGDMTLAAETFDTGTENLHDTARADAPIPGAPGVGPSGGEELPDLEARLSREISLREHLLVQIGQMRAADPLPALAAALVEELDADGYFRADPRAVAGRLGAEAGEVEAALGLLQGCEPAGVAARSLSECFALQLAEAGGPDPEMRRLLDRLDTLATAGAARLCREAGIEPGILGQMLGELRRLDPYPARTVAPERVETVVADVLMRPDAMVGWQVELNPDTLPRVLIDQSYAARIGGDGTELRSFLRKCREDATWLTRSLDQRARTILKVAAEIVARQDAFFRIGIAGLAPLGLAQVAEAVDLHESTVSRVTANKFIATPRGVLPLKFFFSNAVGGGEGQSSDAVRDRIRRLIEAEPPEAVLSDDRIVQILTAEGTGIARRTVAKYRKLLGLGSSAERRRQKSLRLAR